MSKPILGLETGDAPASSAFMNQPGNAPASPSKPILGHEPGNAPASPVSLLPLSRT